MSNEYGPFDRFVEFLVLALIAYEVGTNVWGKKKTSRRVASIFALMHKGEEILAHVPPSGNADTGPIPPWKQSVDAWVKETTEFLAACSPQASAVFLHNKGGVLQFTIMVPREMRMIILLCCLSV
jgi:hypothetical protein